MVKTLMEYIPLLFRVLSYKVLLYRAEPSTLGSTVPCLMFIDSGPEPKTNVWMVPS
jgi:hypothetical protein